MLGTLLRVGWSIISLIVMIDIIIKQINILLSDLIEMTILHDLLMSLVKFFTRQK